MKSIALLLLLPVVAFGADNYQLGEESLERLGGAPAGKVERFQFSASEVFPGTSRDCWVYIPAQYAASKPAALMVFQDGHAYVSETRDMRIPIVFDNLIHQGEMPVTIGLFVNPGHRGESQADGAGWGPRNNRSFEYDSMGDAYGRFLIEEMIPFAAEKFGLNLTNDPKLRAICGISSGGICAWTAAWERPDYFSKVLSHIGSFVNIRGGHVYPALIRKTERKPIRVFLQDGSNDLNNLHGNWPLGNQQMASALAFTGYDFKFVYGDGAHSGKHGGAILPDSLRWLWRSESASLPKPLTKDNLGGDEALSKVLPDGGRPGDWELVGEGYGFTDGACGDSNGNFYFSDLRNQRLYRVDGAKGGRPVPQVWLDEGPRVSGMKFGPDGKLYAATQGDDSEKRIVAIDPKSRSIETVATRVSPNDLIVSKAGWIYFTDTRAGTVVSVPTGARDMPRPSPAAGGITRPNGIALSPAQDMLYVSEHGGTHVWAFLVAIDGTLHSGERYMTLRLPVDREDSGGDGMTVDERGRAYVTSHIGIQMFDWTGRLGGVISKPQDKGTVSCAFAGAYLYVCSSDKVYRRKTLTEAAVIP